MDVLREEPSFKHGSHFDAAKAALADTVEGNKSATKSGELCTTVALHPALFRYKAVLKLHTLSLNNTTLHDTTLNFYLTVNITLLHFQKEGHDCYDSDLTRCCSPCPA